MADTTKMTPLEQEEFQLENVQGWISANDHESALIKALCLKEAVDLLIDELSKKVPNANRIKESWQ